MPSDTTRENTYINIIGKCFNETLVRFLSVCFVLVQIWDLSDPGGKGYLDKAGLYVALKMVALVQNGKEPSLANVNLPTPPPNMVSVCVCVCVCVCIFVCV